MARKQFMSKTNSPLLPLDEENKYLKLSIVAIREKMEALNLSISDQVQLEHQKSSNEILSLKSFPKASSIGFDANILFSM